MLAFVEHLADWASGVPLFVLCTARPELYEREPSWGGGTRNHTAVSLSPLSADETAQLIAVLLDQTVLPAETQRALMDRAGGNPLYAEEFIRMLVDRGVLVRHGASWELTAGEGDIPVPENVHALIAARLDTLSAERKALLQDAAILGKVFWAGALAEMGGLDEDTVRAGLHELARKELLRPARRSSIDGEAEYAFWHMLIRDVAYGQIPRAQRAAGHRAAAAWIERMAGERVAEYAEVLAHHYERAIELSRASGEDTGDLERRAVRFLLVASERATRLDVEKAIELNRRALALTTPGQPERLQVLLSVARSSIFGCGVARPGDRVRPRRGGGACARRPSRGGRGALDPSPGGVDRRRDRRGIRTPRSVARDPPGSPARAGARPGALPQRGVRRTRGSQRPHARAGRGGAPDRSRVRDRYRPGRAVAVPRAGDGRRGRNA